MDSRKVLSERIPTFLEKLESIPKISGKFNSCLILPFLDIILTFSKLRIESKNISQFVGEVEEYSFEKS